MKQRQTLFKLQGFSKPPFAYVVGYHDSCCLNQGREMGKRPRQRPSETKEGKGTENDWGRGKETER